MRQFIIKFIIFTCLWGLILYENLRPGDIAFSFLMLAASFACFFFLSKRNPPLFLYVLLSCIMIVHSIFILEQTYTILLLLFILILASFRIESKRFYLLLSLDTVYVFSVILIHDYPVIPWSITVIACSSLLVLLVQRQEKNSAQQLLYETILAEFRQLKRLHISKEEIAKAEERTRIARELHDSVGHRLTALMMKIEMLYLKGKNEELVELKQMANDSLKETREAVSALETSEEMGIGAIVQLIRKLEAESQLMIEFTIREGILSIPLSNEQGIVLYRVIQEALTNVMRHSSSKIVQIELGKTATGGIMFTIHNPLTGSINYEEGFGIRNMRARLAELNGSLDVYQTENKFIVKGTVPIYVEENVDVANTYRG